MPLINPTVGAISQFIAPFDLKSDIESSWKSPINSSGLQFTRTAIFNGPLDPKGYQGTTFDQISTIETTWINPISNKLTAVKPDAYPKTYDPTTFVIGNTYPNPSDLPLAPKTDIKVLLPDTDGFTFNPIKAPDTGSFTYDPSKFETGKTYPGPKELTLDPEKDVKTVIQNTDKFTFNPISKADNQSFTHDPSKFIVTSSYSADIKKVALNPVTEQLVNSYSTDNFNFSPIAKSDDEVFTYDPSKFRVGDTYKDRKKDTLKNNTNSQLSQFAIKAGATAIAATTVGVPQVAQAAQAALLAGFNGISSQYSTLPHDALTRKDQTAAILYPDFRAKQVLYGAVNKIRLDGTAAAFRGSKIAKGYVAASATLGAYAVFNIDGAGQTGYGIGDPGTPLKIRTDFTMRSHVAKNFNGTSYVPTTNFIEKHTPFVGDRVNVIDYQKSRELDKTKGLKDIYKWNTNGKGKNSYTRDFIKFFFTGPGINKDGTGKDDIIVFRATIGSLSDRFSPQWTEQRFVGRADPNYTYTQYSRELDLDFTIIATDRDELQPIWRKLNALASYTTPEYNTNSLAPIGPWMRFTLGDLYQQQPCFISSLDYTLHDTDTTWEINIEDDPAIMQSPHKISVSLGLTLVTDTIPQKNGVFYGLNNQKTGWLKDFNQTVPAESAAAPLVPVEGVVRNNNFNSINPLPSFNLV